MQVKMIVSTESDIKNLFLTASCSTVGRAQIWEPLTQIKIFVTIN
jgi:hypothetical protein